jgi:antitoxin ParD1/3/4
LHGIKWQTLPSKEQAVSLNVSLPVELENRVREHVASGMYGSASEVIREALRLFEAYQATQTSQLQALRADIQLGLADVKAKRVGALDVDAIKRQGRQRLKQTAK